LHFVSVLESIILSCFRDAKLLTATDFFGFASGENNPNTIQVSPVNEGGICIFIEAQQRDEWGPSLTSLGWVDRGNPAGFGCKSPRLRVPCLQLL